ncbi:ankyrin repeat domain-containing protein [Wolbachia endosymbiont of Kradibia gibbosae]|uniref:ankyrin repeat domain-containing protein n=1 Tax=Wolbachia endosymbiont of Kradibia gibbosae TaxID=2742716 RepID=UPI0018D9FA90|nr:ankyrin repeat domain-containing protein [Wolbachia endosymbiont of Kradibia gibbosae]MBH5362504.1 ankyrin repeat domain-containing protein [Wolbachia endosymbiont of Kradibia gibbosae]
MYQARWLMLFPKHAVDREYSFRLFTEKKSAKDFDDIVLRYEQDGKIVHRFIQVKHRQGRHKKISIGDLLTPGKDGAFGLIKYLIAYLKIKSSGEFEGEIEDFVIITNDDFDSADSTSHPVRKLRMMPSGKNKGKEISVIRIDTQDEFLDVGDGVRYKFDNSIISYLQENKDFVKREVGREVSNKEIEDFLNKLVFAVNLPSGTELSEIIKSELGKEFSNTDAKHFYSRYQEEVLILLEKEEEEFLSYEKAKALLEEIREEILGAVWFDVRGPFRLFTGRDEDLGMLHDSLQRNPKGAVISYITSISGPGGMGKSQLARKYACKYRRYYDDNVIWIGAENFEAMKDSFLRLARNRLGISPKDKYGNDKTIETIVREVYAFFARRRSLFIFDNVQEYKKISKFLPFSLSPDLNKPHILITSHDQELEKGIDVIKLGELEQRDAIEFVKKGFNILKKDKSQDREIENLVRRLQCFPLAIQQAISYIEDQRIIEKFKISDYLKEYEKKAKKLLKSKIFQGIDNNYTKTTFTAWEVTMDKVRSDEQYGPLASEILDVLAYFAPDKIAREIFLNSVSDYKKKQLKLAIRLLVRYSMVGGEQNQSVLNVHRLVQEVTRLKLQENRQEEKTLRKALELINSGDLAKDSKIHVASIWGYASKHGRLIDDFYKDTNLHLLVENDDYKAIKNLLAYIKKKHQDKLSEIVNAKDGCDIAPLHLAAGNGKLDIVKYLINKGASIDVRDCFYQTPLYWAAKSGELDMVKYLVNKGASVDIEDSYGWTALYWAVENENFYIAEYLIKEKGIDVSARYSNGKTMLHEAIRFAKLDAVRYLIGKGIDIDIKDGYGGTPLHWAAIRGKIDMVRYFIEQGADVNAKDNDDLTSLHWAVLYANLKVVRCLVEDGSDVDAKDKRGWTPLHLIAKNNRLLWGDDLNEMLGTTEYFIQKGADVNAKDKDGNTPLHLAAMNGKIDVAKVLLKHNADVNAKNNEGRTALHYATDFNHRDLVELLLAHGASIL